MYSFINISLITGLLFIQTLALCQCLDIDLIDPSFETGELDWENGWNQDDGLDFVSSPVYDGNYAVCSNGGGVIQNIDVLPSTTYHLSCWVKNGLDDFTLRVDLYNSTNSILMNDLISTNDWQLASMPFTTGDMDTLVAIRYWSNSACVDLFQVTCDPVSSINEDFAKKTNCYPNPTKDKSIISFPNPTHEKYSLSLYSMKGKMIRTIPNIRDTNIELKRNGLSNGVYFYQLSNDNGMSYTGKWILK